MDKNSENFIQQNSPDGGFLQSEQWRKFQKKVGRRTFCITGDDFYAGIIEHALPIVGKYFYVPRGPIALPRGEEFPISNPAEQDQFPNKSQFTNSKIQKGILEIINLARKENAGWIRIEPTSEEVLNEIKNSTKYKIIKAPHDMQPREILILDITKLEEQLLNEMKAKTRYNIRLAEKKEVRIKKQEESGEYAKDFLRLAKITASRNKIISHPDFYYRKMLEVIPSDILKLYVAEYKSTVIAANLMVFYGDTCIYLHGGSDDKYKNLMAPYLLQWQAILDAKEAGYERYDLGGIKTQPHPSPPRLAESKRVLSKERECHFSFSFIRRRIKDEVNSWSGITRFKLGFSPNTKPMEFPGCYDIVLSPVRYWLYRNIQRIKSFI